MTRKLMTRSPIHIVTVVALALFVSAPALAAEFERVEGRVRENIPAGPFLAAAYAFIWVAVLVYVAIIARKLGRVQAEIDQLRAKLDGKR